MMTLSINVSSMPQEEENAALLSPCHNQISLLVAAFYGWRAAGSINAAAFLLLMIAFLVLALFL
jgi:hypothetical protein